MNSFEIEQDCFGRAAVLDVLKKRVIGLKEGYRQNVAILGNQFVGKSLILQHFLLNFDNENVVAVYLDLENKDFHYFFHKFTTSLLYNFSKSQDLPLHEDLNLLVESTKSHIPHTVQVIKKIQNDFYQGKVSETYLGLLMLPEIFTNESGYFCVLIIDEFQNLGELSIAHAYQDLGKKIMTQKKCLYVLASSYPGVARKILSEKLSLLFGNFEVVDVEAFDLKSSLDFIDYKLKTKKIGAQLRNFLTDFTGGHPLYLNLICQNLLSLSALHNQNEIYMPLLSQAVENTIFDRWGVISRHFELTIRDLCEGKGNKGVSSVLISLANGKNKVDQLSKDVNMKKTQLMPKVNRLLELGIVVKNGNFYYLKDRLFKYWVKYVYQKRLKDVELSSEKQRRQFKEEFNRCVESFKVTSRKDLSSRIIELFHCFDNEAFDLNGRRYQLPNFEEIVPFRVRNDNGIFVDAIKASTKDAVWVICLRKESFTESDVSVILSEAKKSGLKARRYLMISLSGLDDNARLKALQEKFWIWNEGELNTLLTLFDKPYILG